MQQIFSCLRFRILKFLFPNTPKRYISPSAQKSVLATAIIKQIISSQPPTSFNDLSLRDKILQLNPLIDNTEINPQIKNQVFQMFTTGIKLHQQFSNQHRVMLSAQIKDSYKDKMTFLFFPNYLSTRQIFKLLLQQRYYQSNSKPNILLKGGFGMGKTFSFLLYILISNYIHQFYHQAQENQQSRVLFQYLTKQNLVTTVPKCFYWTSCDQIPDIKKIEYTKYFIELIYEQTTDLPKQKRKILKSKHIFNEFIQYFMKVYPSSLHKKLIIDQVFYLTQIAQVLMDKNNNNRDSWHNFNLSFTIVHKFKLFADECILVSSIDYQKKYFEQTKGQNVGYNLQISKQIEFQCQKLLRYQKWAKFDFWNYYWFELQRRLKVIQHKIQLSQLKKIFFEKCIQKQVQIKPYYRFIYISKYLKSTSRIYPFIKKEQSEQSIKIDFNCRIDNFHGISTYKMRQRIIQYMKNYQDQTSKRQYLLQLYSFVVNYCEKEPNYKQYKDFDNHLQKWEQKFNKGKEQNYKFSEFLRHLYQISQPKLLLTPYQIIQLLTQILYSQNNLFTNIFKNTTQFLNNPRRYFLYYHILCCLKKNNLIKIQLATYQQKEGFFDLVSDKRQALQLKIKVQSLFVSLYNQLEDNYLKGNFKYIFQSRNDDSQNENSENSENSQNRENSQNSQNNQNSQNSQNQDNQDENSQNENQIVAFPYKIQCYFSEFDKNSLVIDFLITKQNKQSKTFTFYTFDLSLSKDIKQVEQKQQKAIIILNYLLQQYNKLQQSKQMKICFKHIIICSNQTIPSKICKQKHQRNEKNGLEILYADWKSIKFERIDKGYNQKIQAFDKVIKSLKQYEDQLNL